MYRFKQGISDPTDDGFMYHAITDCETNPLVIGVYPVMYGFRVRAGYKGEMSYSLDYCCGNEKGDVELIYSAVKNIIEQRSEKPFIGFPVQNQKPFMRNEVEFKQLLDMIDKTTYVRQHMPDIHEIKRSYMHNHFGHIPLIQHIMDRK
jgi:hypothetical protein